MNNFDYNIGTEIFFGRGQLEKLPAAIKKYADKVLLVYGGGSIKRIGLYERLTLLLKENGIEYVELAGVEPNPRVTTVNKGAALCREHGVQAVLAVGGGSTIDCAKVVAAATFYQGDAWDLVMKKEPVTEVLPVFSVLTLAATGSEMDPTAVITNWETNDKQGVSHPAMRPKASVLDPEYTYTVPANQTAAGTADIMSHIMENYFSRVTTGFVQDRLAEGLLRTCIQYGKVAVQEPDHYEARANLMWASSLAINGLISLGKSCPWSVHSMEHQLSAYYDITHGVGLAILTPAWMRYVLCDETLDKFAAFGVNVWGIDKDLPKEQIAEQAIQMTQDYFVQDLHIPATLHEVGIGEENLQVMAQKAATPALQQAFRPLDTQDVLRIYKACL